MADRAWMQLHQVLSADVDAMAWRLAKLTDEEREALLEELTDRLSAKVRLADKF